MPVPSGHLTRSGRRLDPAGDAPAFALAAAAGLHLAALPDHAGQGLDVAGFFLATAVFQLAAAWVVGPGGAGARGRIGIAVGNLALVALWAWSRIVGLPLGDHAGPEAVSLLDGLAVAAEIIAVAGLCLNRGAARDRRTGVSPGAALLTIMILTGAGAVRWLPANHASQHEREHQQERQHEPIHPTTETSHVTAAEGDHNGTGVASVPCPNGCEAHPSDDDPPHDDIEHTHP